MRWEIWVVVILFVLAVLAFGWIPELMGVDDWP